ncbi:hypothetical protein KFE98_03130 [bacterium SCSIO 12741]|nr:hypothetical protein KFE98_03130 [bacterium SCSIO 12741]
MSRHLILLSVLSITLNSCAQSNSENDIIVDSNTALPSPKTREETENNLEVYEEEEYVFDFSPYHIQTHPDSSISYQTVLNHLSAKRNDLVQSGLTGDSLYEQAGHLFTESLINQIIPYWYGTKWDFEGHTNTPGEGQVACGYFVSTTLRHAQIQINRYRLAQQHGLNEAKSLQPEEKLIDLNSEEGNWGPVEEIVDSLSRLPEGLYFVGLDNHVGYLLHREKGLFFLHSSYMDPVAVVIEPLNDSEAFWASNRWVLADITHNRFLMEKWLKQETISVVR